MLLYHGRKEQVRFPKIRKAVFNKDFYFGFYCTLQEEQAVRQAARFYNKWYLNIYEYTPNRDLKYLRFHKITDEWLDFVTSCRLGNGHSYDIVEGPRADETIFNYVQNFVDGKISRSAFWKLAKYNHPTYQISFHTISALDTLEFIESREG